MRLLFIILFLSYTKIFAQQYFPLLAPEMMASDSATHSSLRLYGDNLPNNLSFSFEKKSLKIIPLFENTEYVQITDSKFPFNINAGFGLIYTPSKNITISTSFWGGFMNFSEYASDQYAFNYDQENTGTINLLDSNTFSPFLAPNIDFSYQISHVFSIHTGNSKVFLGEGYRSLFLSDQGANAPHLSLKMNLGKVQYLYRLQLEYQDYYTETGQKYSAMHYLSWNFLKRWNLSVFEAVTWQNADSVRPRGMEWTYLNPILFFRPAEFAIGSPDNMLIGGGLSFRAGKKTTIYTQILLDEFYISEIKNWVKHTLHPADTTIPYGAWVNKHAFQIGIKSFGIAGIDGLSAVAEFNYVRPYTYSHVNPLNSYSHNNQPLAHPFGANFYEVLLRIDYQNARWHFISHTFYKRTGFDEYISQIGPFILQTHNGQNILLSTFDSPRGNNIPVAYYGNVVGQGIPVKILHHSMEVRYKILLKNNPVWLRLGTTIRKETIQNTKSVYFNLFCGLLINMQGQEQLHR